MIEVYDTTFARVTEVKRGMLVRRLAGFHAVVDLRVIEDDAVRLWLDDGSTVTLRAMGPSRWRADGARSLIANPGLVQTDKRSGDPG